MKKRIISNDRKYKVQGLRTFFWIPLYWKTFGYWDTKHGTPYWTHYEFDSLQEAREWAVEHSKKMKSNRIWKVIEKLEDI